MKRLHILLTILVQIGFVSCTQLTSDEIEYIVLEGERERIPLTIQSLNILFVEEIRLDSFVLLTDTDIEPMYGMLYTTWISSITKDTTSMIVSVDSIQTSTTNKNYVEWQSRWDVAAISYTVDRFHNILKK